VYEKKKEKKEVLLIIFCECEKMSPVHTRTNGGSRHHHLLRRHIYYKPKSKKRGENRNSASEIAKMIRRVRFCVQMLVFENLQCFKLLIEKNAWHPNVLPVISIGIVRRHSCFA
jgi:hypothetical protein